MSGYEKNSIEICSNNLPKFNSFDKLKIDNQTNSSKMQSFDIFYLSFSNVKFEWLATVSWRVDLLAIGEGQDVVACDFLASFGESGAISGTKNFDINTHD